jgi:hypothetical protein
MSVIFCFALLTGHLKGLHSLILDFAGFKNHTCIKQNEAKLIYIYAPET